MNTPNTFPRMHRFLRNASAQEKGVALVIVLAILVIVLTMALGFIDRVGTERVSSSGYKSSSIARGLADSAVAMVQAQIREATVQTNVSWISQPGMVRTFGTDGAFREAFKLYSAAQMTTTSNAGLTSVDRPPSDWAAHPATWVDLNAPGTVDGVTNFPILDPRATGTVSGVGAVEGFQIDFPPGATSYQPVPMPVRWLYTLQDGRLVAPTGTGGTVTVPGATSNNPIVGRVAFWTDDDTCKVNINTASEGKAWTAPYFGGANEHNLANQQPVRNEYQRYQGHPAMTSLSAVFPTNATITRQRLIEITPRYQWGGSQDGNMSPIATTPLTPPANRLYTSLDEMIFSQNRAVNSFMTKDLIETRQFFVTANSRAPELNLFNLPRVSIWPLHANTNSTYRTAYDRTIAFCSSLQTGVSQKRLYSFLRANYDSTTADLSSSTTHGGENIKLMSYLHRLLSTTIPGVGHSTNFMAKYSNGPNLSDDDGPQILTQIFDYIRCTNICDTSDPNLTTYTPDWNDVNDPKDDHGFVLPIRYAYSHGGVTLNTSGFGRAYSVSEVAIQFIATADGTGFLINNARPTLAQCQGLANAHRQNNARLDSNVASGTTRNYTLPSGTPAKGEPYLDVGIWNGTSYSGGAANGKFDWTDSGFDPTRCNFEPWTDTNQNGIWDPGEPYSDTGMKGYDSMGNLITGPGAGNGRYDRENHEPLHDWGRDSNFGTSDADGSQGTGNAGVPRGNGVYDFGEVSVQAIIWLEMFSPMHGWTQCRPRMGIRVQGLNAFAVNGTNLGFPSGANTSSPTDANYGKLWMGHWAHHPYYLHHGRTHGGYPGARWLFMRRYLPARGVIPADNDPHSLGWSGVTAENVYPFVSAPVRITNNGTMEFTGGPLTITIYHAPTAATNPTAANTIQTIQINFPNGTMPTPRLQYAGTPSLAAWEYPQGGSVVIPPSDMKNWWTFHRCGAIRSGGSQQAWSNVPGFYGRMRWPEMNNAWWACTQQGDRYQTTPASMIRDSEQWWEEKWNQNPSGQPIPDTRGDVMRSVTVRNGDLRLTSVQPTVPATDLAGSFFDKNERAGDWNSTSNWIRHNLFDNVPQWVTPGWQIQWPWTPSTQIGSTLYVPGANYAWTSPPDLAANASASPAATGDFDNGLASNLDGPFINKPDEGNIYRAETGLTPYFNNDEREADGPTFFSPNRIIPSPGMFGSLPTGVKGGIPWRTLLFRPQPGHFGYDNFPRDHNLLDLFWMPVVEPYVISDRFSTSGKINMNYQILPFNYITRETGMHAVLKNEQMAVVSKSGPEGENYKNRDPVNYTYRFPINIDRTLAQFRQRFINGDVFRSASEICDIHVIPKLPSAAENSYVLDAANRLQRSGGIDFWSDFGLTGDNLRERIYTNLYGRLTTKSNTFTVYVRAQAIRKPRNDPHPDQWNEVPNQIVGEYRGATSIERFIDPNRSDIPDYADRAAQGLSLTPTLDAFYLWRVVGNRQFAP